MAPGKKARAKTFWNKKRDEELLLVWLENNQEKHAPLILDVVRELIEERGLRLPVRDSDEGRRLLALIKDTEHTKKTRHVGLRKAKRINHGFAVAIAFLGGLGFQVGRMSDRSYVSIAAIVVCIGLGVTWRICIWRVRHSHQLQDRKDLQKI